MTCEEQKQYLKSNIDHLTTVNTEPLSQQIQSQQSDQLILEIFSLQENLHKLILPGNQVSVFENEIKKE